MGLKKIIYKGETYLYEVSKNMFDGGTYVYSSTPIEYIERKYVIFGPKIVKVKYDYLFYTSIDIEDPCYSKKLIESKFKDRLAYYEREKEIENGNIL